MRNRPATASDAQIKTIQAMAYEVQNFQEDVLETSREIPVVVDFWAPWCGPCQVLGPVLEGLAQEADGRWKLAKVNTDENQELAMQYGIRGIPAVKMFIDGRVAEEFTGALPRHAVQQWLERAIPSEGRMLAEQAQAELAAGRTGQARALLQEALDADPQDAAAAVTMAQLEVFESPETATRLLDDVEVAEPALAQAADGVLALARLLSLNGTADTLPEGPARQQYALGIEALKKRDFDGALDAFISVIATDRYYDDDGARKACLAIFGILGEESETTRAHRRQFNMALY
jgi:putative thioredoxin